MLRVDGYYLYELGHRIHGISQIRIFPFGDERPHTCSETLSFLYPAKLALDEFMTASVYKMRTIQKTALEFREMLNWAIEHCEVEGNKAEIPTTDMMFQVQEKHREFEAVLKGEFAAANIYLVMQQSAFDTSTLIECGELAFPSETITRAPEAIEDLRQAMRCIVFELPTAAAFHLHRANELVLGKYWDSVSDGEPRPKSQTLGSYLFHLEKDRLGSAAVLSALKDIKNLHRNPTIHADQSIESSEEAIDLQGAVRASIGAMLKEIRDDVDAAN